MGGPVQIGRPEEKRGRLQCLLLSDLKMRTRSSKRSIKQDAGDGTGDTLPHGVVRAASLQGLHQLLVSPNMSREAVRAASPHCL